MKQLRCGGKCDPMSTTVTMSEAGLVELPIKVRRRFQLKGPTRLDLVVSGDGITLRPKQTSGAAKEPPARRRSAVAPTAAAAPGATRLVRRGKLLVATGFPAGVDIAAAIEAERDARDVELAGPFLRRRTPRR